jgi:hypothetical protein
MSPHAPRPPSHIVSFAIPAIEPRQAEVLMDLLEAYGEAILAAVDDSCKDVEDAPSSGSDDSSPF